MEMVPNNNFAHRARSSQVNMLCIIDKSFQSGHMQYPGRGLGNMLATMNKQLIPQLHEFRLNS